MKKFLSLKNNDEVSVRRPKSTIKIPQMTHRNVRPSAFEVETSDGFQKRVMEKMNELEKRIQILEFSISKEKNHKFLFFSGDKIDRVIKGKLPKIQFEVRSTLTSYLEDQIGGKFSEILNIVKVYQSEYEVRELEF